MEMSLLLLLSTWSSCWRGSSVHSMYLHCGTVSTGVIYITLGQSSGHCGISAKQPCRPKELNTGKNSGSREGAESHYGDHRGGWVHPGLQLVTAFVR